MKINLKALIFINRNQCMNAMKTIVIGNAETQYLDKQ